SGTAVADLVAGEGTRKLVKPATARFTPNNKRVITAVLAGSAVVCSPPSPPTIRWWPRWLPERWPASAPWSCSSDTSTQPESAPHANPCSRTKTSQCRELPTPLSETDDIGPKVWLRLRCLDTLDPAL